MHVPGGTRGHWHNAPKPFHPQFQLSSTFVIPQEPESSTEEEHSSSQQGKQHPSPATAGDATQLNTLDMHSPLHLTTVSQGAADDANVLKARTATLDSQPTCDSFPCPCYPTHSASTATQLEPHCNPPPANEPEALLSSRPVYRLHHATCLCYQALTVHPQPLLRSMMHPPRLIIHTLKLRNSQKQNVLHPLPRFGMAMAVYASLRMLLILLESSCVRGAHARTHHPPRAVIARTLLVAPTPPQIPPQPPTTLHTLFPNATAILRTHPKSTSPSKTTTRGCSDNSMQHCTNSRLCDDAILQNCSQQETAGECVAAFLSSCRPYRASNASSDGLLFGSSNSNFESNSATKLDTETAALAGAATAMGEAVEVRGLGGRWYDSDRTWSFGGSEHCTWTQAPPITAKKLLFTASAAALADPFPASSWVQQAVTGAAAAITAFPAAPEPALRCNSTQADLDDSGATSSLCGGELECDDDMCGRIKSTAQQQGIAEPPVRKAVASADATLAEAEVDPAPAEQAAAVRVDASNAAAAAIQEPAERTVTAAAAARFEATPTPLKRTVTADAPARASAAEAAPHLPVDSTAPTAAASAAVSVYAAAVGSTAPPALCTPEAAFTAQVQRAAAARRPLRVSKANAYLNVTKATEPPAVASELETEQPRLKKR